MTNRRSHRTAYVVGLLALAALPLAARALGSPEPERCVVDGRPLPEALSVRVVSGSHETRRLCGVTCADRWLAREDGADAAAHEVFVVDETSGREVPADEAFFVRSLVAHPVTRDRVHAFARRDDAERHARAFAGRILEGPDRPFSSRTLRREAGAGSVP
jgi:hypothetical protein